MGGRGSGRKHKPTAVLKLHGSPAAKKRKQEPKPPPGRPICPTFIDKCAKAAWRQLIPQLAEMGVLTQVDRNALIRYCQTWSRWRRCAEFINDHGETYQLKDDQGNFKCLQQWPQVAIYNKLSDTLSKLESEFGLTPSARAGLQVDPSTIAATDKKAAYFA